MKRRFSACLACMSAAALMASAAGAQVKLDALQVQTRVDFESLSEGGSGTDGFSGKYFNLYLAGGMGEKLSYSYRQRFTKSVLSSSYWDATDWAWVDWKFSDRWSVNAGKQVVAIGGFEYDRAPINLYQCSEFWNNIACYQFGVSASYAAGSGDLLKFQICQSPNRTYAQGMYAYNFIWYGSHGPWSTIYSVNMVESVPGEYQNFISLGNRLSFGCMALELDWMNRKTLGKGSPFADFSVMAELSARPSDSLNIFLKYTHDENKDNPYDFCVLGGTGISRAGAGLEFFPLKSSRALRLHAQGAWCTGFNSNKYGVLRDGQLMLDCGVTFMLDLLKAGR